MYDDGAESSAINSDVAFSKTKVQGLIPVPLKPYSSEVGGAVFGIPHPVCRPAPSVQIPA